MEKPNKLFGHPNTSHTVISACPPTTGSLLPQEHSLSLPPGALQGPSQSPVSQGRAPPEATLPRAPNTELPLCCCPDQTSGLCLWEGVSPRRQAEKCLRQGPHEEPLSSFQSRSLLLHVLDLLDLHVTEADPGDVTRKWPHQASNWASACTHCPQPC